MTQSMTALVLGKDGKGLCSQLASMPLPRIARDEVRVRVHYASVNRLDVMLQEGRIRTNHPLPLVMGLDASGLVEQLGEDASGLSLGQEVGIYPIIFCGHCRFCNVGEQSQCTSARFLGLHRHGTFAELVTAPARNVVPLCGGMPLETAACLPSAYLTAWRMVVTKAQVRPGETVVVVGSGGGVAQAAIQWARLCGARVIVTAGSDEKVLKARLLGADAGFNYGHGNVVERVNEYTSGEGADVVINSVGGATWIDSLRMAARGARVVTCGVMAGEDAPADLRRIFMRELTIFGSTLGNIEEFKAMLAAVAARGIVPPIHKQIAFEDAPDALQEMKGSHFGKITLKFSAGKPT